MKKNVGSIDRMIRIFAGIALIIWGLMSGQIWGALGIIPLLTGIIRWCPAYCPFGISTGGDKKCGTNSGCC